ncbi:MAG: hypothetical protein E2590_12700 [Chryseobacterium sp.]|nr:hypothetical protein [Chryseobacterium sp.]
MKKFNINNTVKIKLTDLGCKVLADEHNQWSVTEDHRTPEYYKNKCDEKGYYTIQLWQLMNIFGSSLSMGCNLSFETNILIENSNLKEHES